MLRLPDTSSWDSFPYVVGKDAFHQLMTIMNSLHLHETTKDTSVVYQPISVMYVESKTWKAPSSAFVYKEISWFVPLFLIAISVAPIYRVINDKVTDRVRILFLNNVTSSLYVTSLLLFYTLFFFVITCVLFIVIMSLGAAFHPSFLFFLLLAWESIHASAFYVAFATFFSSPVIASSANVLLNIIAAYPFLYGVESNSPMILTLLPGGAISLFTTQSVKTGGEALSLIRQGFVWSVVSVVICVAIAYLIMWFREDLLNMMDRVGLSDGIHCSTTRRRRTEPRWERVPKASWMCWMRMSSRKKPSLIRHLMRSRPPTARASVLLCPIFLRCSSANQVLSEYSRKSVSPFTTERCLDCWDRTELERPHLSAS